MLREPNWQNSLNCNKAIFRVQKTSLSMFWECLPSLVNIASDWLRAKSSPLNEEKIKMDDNVNTSLTLGGIYLFVDLWEAQPCLQKPK